MVFLRDYDLKGKGTASIILCLNLEAPGRIIVPVVLEAAMQ